jgi:hypothetical protein
LVIEKKKRGKPFSEKTGHPSNQEPSVIGSESEKVRTKGGKSLFNKINSLGRFLRVPNIIKK